MQVELVRFDAHTRGQLTLALRRARPRPNVAAIIRALEKAAQVVTIIRASSDPATVHLAFERLILAASKFRRALAEARRAADDLLAGAKARLRFTPDFEERLIEGLDMLEALVAAATPRRRNPKGGRPRGGAALVAGVPALASRWLAPQVADILRAHGVKPSQHNDGLYADVLRAIWSPVIGSELHGDIRRLLRDGCTQ